MRQIECLLPHFGTARHAMGRRSINQCAVCATVSTTTAICPRDAMAASRSIYAVSLMKFDVAEVAAVLCVPFAE